jgi:thioredoxin reductase (NADPH)
MDYDVAIAGSGIAGLTAALTSARLGWRTVVIGGELLGGSLLSIAQIDGFPGFPEGIAGYDLCPMVQEQAATAGAEFTSATLDALEERGGAWTLTTSEGEYAARAVILATGARLRELDVPGAARLRGKGVSHCASCDAPFMRDKPVAVVGGGDSAAQEALTLAECAARVVMLHRGDALVAQDTYRARITAQAKIELQSHTTVEEIVGDPTVSAIRYRDESGQTTELAVAGVFAYVGLAPNTACVNGLLEFDSEGRIPVDTELQTRHAGLYAAGAVRSGWGGRAAVSAGDGAAAALSADRYLRHPRQLATHG